MFTKSQIELRNHIEAKNSEGKKWLDENPRSYYGMTVSDPAHWAELGITSIVPSEYHMEYYGLFDYIAGKTLTSLARYFFKICFTLKALDYAYQQFERRATLGHIFVPLNYTVLSLPHIP